jgi:hypothetical protein
MSGSQTSGSSLVILAERHAVSRRRAGEQEQEQEHDKE